MRQVCAQEWGPLNPDVGLGNQSTVCKVSGQHKSYTGQAPLVLGRRWGKRAALFLPSVECSQETLQRASGRVVVSKWVGFILLIPPHLKFLAMGSFVGNRSGWASIFRRPGLGSPSHRKEAGLKPTGVKQKQKQKNHPRSGTSTSRAAVANL